MAFQSRLEIEVDSGGAKPLVDGLRKSLDDLYEAGSRVSSITLGTGLQNSASSLPSTISAASKSLQDIKKSSESAAAATDKLGETLEAQKARLLSLGKAAVAEVEARRQLASAAVGLSEAEQGLLSGRMVLSARQPKQRAETEAQTESTKKATLATDAQRASLQTLLGSIDPATRALNRLDEQERQLSKNKKLGLLDNETFGQYKAKIDEARSALGRFDNAQNKTGISAKQNAAALRMLPAQFSDIIVSLQGGQAPFTVLLQQGSQIKDSFGGIGPALKQTAAYAAGMINPLTLAAAAMAVLALAYKQGSDETTAYNTSLAMTGNTAGVTTGQLGAMARQVAESSGTVGKAAAVLALLARSTRIPATEFESLTKTIVDFESATGQAASESVANFEKIAKDPTAEILRLNESMNFLTASTYTQIKALQEQGNTQEAARLANEAYKEGMDRTAKGITENLGYVEASWRAAAKFAKEAWDAFLNIGREDSLEEKLAEVDRQLQKLANGGNNRSQVAGRFGYLPSQKENEKAVLDGEKTQLLLLKAEKDRRAASQGLAQQQQKQALDDQIQLDKLRDQSATNETKRTKALAEYREVISRREAQAKRTGDKSLLISAEQQAKDIAAIEAKYKDPKTPQTPTVREDSGQKLLDDARQRYAVLQQQAQAINGQLGDTQKLGTEARRLIELETEIANLKEKKTLTAAQRQVLAMADLNLAQQRQNAELEKSNELVKARLENEAKLKAFTENLNDQIALTRQGYENELAGAGMGDRTKSRLQEQLKLQQDYQKQLSRLTRDYGNKSNPTSADTDLYNAETAKVKAALATQLEDQKKHYQDLDGLRGQWLTGVSESWQNYVDMSVDYNTQAKDATASILGDTTSSISSSLQGIAKGTETLGSAFVNLGQTMAGSILTALSDIAAKWIVTQTLKMAGIGAETSLVVASEGTKAAAKVAADGVATASSLASIGTVLAANLAAAVETLASWAPAALVASVGSFGAAAAVGGTALLAAYALIKGFSGGGYTGDGAVNTPAGIVHKGEVVWSQADIRRSGGVQAVEAMRTGNISPISTAKSKAAGIGGGLSQTINIIDQNNSNVDVRRKGNGDTDIIIRAATDAAVAEVSNQLASGYGSVVDAGQGAYAWKRVGS